MHNHRGENQRNRDKCHQGNCKKICNKRGQTNAMKYDNLHGHKQEGDSQLQMDEGNNRAQYRRQLPLRTGKPLIPKISAATAAAESHKLCERMATGSISKIAARQHIHTSQPLHCRPLNLSIPQMASATTVRNAGGCIPVSQA